MLSLLQQLTDSVNDLKRRQDELDATLNEHGGKKAKVKSLVAELAKQPRAAVSWGMGCQPVTQRAQ